MVLAVLRLALPFLNTPSLAASPDLYALCSIGPLAHFSRPPFDSHLFPKFSSRPILTRCTAYNDFLMSLYHMVHSLVGFLRSLYPLVISRNTRSLSLLSDLLGFQPGLLSFSFPLSELLGVHDSAPAPNLSFSISHRFLCARPPIYQSQGLGFKASVTD